MRGLATWMRSLVTWEPADIVIHIQEKGVVLREKSLVAYEEENKKILAIGTEAEAWTGKESEGIRVMSPLRQGMIADYAAAVQMFTFLLAKAGKKRWFLKPFLAVCVPEGITPVESKAMEDVFLQIGAKEVVISDFPLNQFLRLQEEETRFSKLCRKCKITVEITKDEPERYIEEALEGILQYAGREGVSDERVAELLKKKK